MTDTPTLAPAAAYALWAASYPPHAHNPLMLAEERAMLALLPGDLRGRALLDAGCGSGRYLRDRQRIAAATGPQADALAQFKLEVCKPLQRTSHRNVGHGFPRAFPSSSSHLIHAGPRLHAKTADKMTHTIHDDSECHMQ